MPDFAANLSWMFKEWSFLDRFAAAADAGFHAVEYLFPYDHKPDDIARRLARHNLKQVLFNLPPGDISNGDRGLAALPERRDEFRASVKTARHYAGATGTTRLHLMAGNCQGEPALAAFQESVKFACESLHDLTVLIEPLNPRDNPGYLMNDFDLAERLITGLALPNLKLQFDVYHRQIIHGDVIRGLEALMPITGHMQVASVPHRHEPTTGELDDLHIFQAIDRLGYQGFIGCEYQPAAGTLEGLSWMKRVSAPDSATAQPSRQ